MSMFKPVGQPRRQRRPSQKQVAKMLDIAFQATGVPENIEQILEALEAQAVDVLAWDGLTPTQRMNRLKCENIRKFMREIMMNVNGKKVRRFQHLRYSESTPFSDAVNIRQAWLDVGRMLIEQTHFEPGTAEDDDARQDVLRHLNLTRQELDQLRMGLTVRINGIDGTMKLVENGFVFQPSLLGETAI